MAHGHFKRFKYAWRGFVQAIFHERSFQIEFVAAVCVQAYAYVRELSFERWAVFTLISGAILAGELFNTALEHISNLLEPRLAVPVRTVKDLLAAGVLVLVVVALVLFVGEVITR